jgi:hypothetical protein
MNHFNPVVPLILLLEVVAFPVRVATCGVVNLSIGAWYQERAKIHKIIREKVPLLFQGQG